MKQFTVKYILEDAQKNHETLLRLVSDHKDVPFLFKGRDENIKDVMYHLVAWHHILLNLVKTNPALPFELKPGYTWANLEALNYSIKQEANLVSLDDVLKVFKHTHETLVDYVLGLDERILNEVGYYPFTTPSNLGEFIHECMGGHYQWAISSIEFSLGDVTLRPLFNQLKTIPLIDAIVLGGSRGKGLGDHTSDYDIYIYSKKEIPVEKRKELLSPYMSLMEYNNQFFETEDDGILNNGVGIEFIYRNLDDFKQMMNRLFELHINRGYSTCFLDNLLTSKIIFDRNNEYQALQDKYRFKDKTLIYQTVIKQNIPLLYGTQPNLYDQILKAVKRGDYVSINHRFTEYFSLFFDTLYAMNQVNHPGEKRMLEFALRLPKKPVNLKARIDFMLNHLTEGNYLEDLKSLTLELIKLSEKA